MGYRSPIIDTFLERWLFFRVCVWRFSLNVAGADKPTNPCYQCLQSVEVGGGER